MYYLVIRNLGREQCIHKSENDEYVDGNIYTCTPDLGPFGPVALRIVHIICSENPGHLKQARVYRDELPS
jgi:hypothetical protein